jgi:predicted metalloendopeptidase
LADRRSQRLRPRERATIHIADIGGLKIAYAAMERALRGQPARAVLSSIRT